MYLINGQTSNLKIQENEHFHHFRFKESTGILTDIINCVVRSCLLAVATAQIWLDGGFLGDLHNGFLKINNYYFLKI